MSTIVDLDELVTTPTVLASVFFKALNLRL